MNWDEEIAAVFARQQTAAEASVVEEMAQHAADAYKAARADGSSAPAAESAVRALIESWCAGTSGPKRIERAPLPPSAPPGRLPIPLRRCPDQDSNPGLLVRTEV